MGKFAILGKLWGYVVQFFAKLYGAKMAEAEAKYAEASKRAAEFEREATFQEALKQSALAANESMRVQLVELTQAYNEKQKETQRLENELESAKKRIAAMSADDVWNAGLSPNATPPIIGGGNA